MKVVFLSLDTLRADRLSCMGYPRGLTPNLDQFAAEGALFTRAFASDIPTQPSHTALFTGRYGANTGIVSHFHPPARLDESIPWFPTIMSDAGYATGAVDHLFAMKDWFVRGYKDYMPPRGRSRSPGSVINEIAFSWITEHADDDFFLFLHYWDAHIPYVPPSPFKERYTAESAKVRDQLILQKLRGRPSYPLFKRNNYDHLGDIPNLEYVADLYDAEIAYLDYELGRLFQHLKDVGAYDDSLIVVFGDHGEVMTDHDSWFDHAGLYDAVTHVPLIIRAPGKVRPVTVPAMVSLVDVLPTVLELLDLPPLGRTDGRSLLPVIDGATDRHRDMVVLSEATWEAKRAVRTEEWKYIRCYDPGVYPRAEDELYHLPTDPEEQVNVAAANPAVVAEMSALLDAWLREQVDPAHDPLVEVVTHGLPAVARLDGIINGTASLPAAMTQQPVLTGAVASDGSYGPVSDSSGSAFLPAPLVPVAASAGAATAIPAHAAPVDTGMPTKEQPAVGAAPVATLGELETRRRGRRFRVVFAAAAAVVAIAVLAFTVNSLLLQNPVQAAAVVEPVTSANLDLPAGGSVSALYVEPGSVVRQGQLLATENPVNAQATLAADQTKLASDEAALAQLQTPESPGTTEELASGVSIAQANLAAAQNEVTQTSTQQSATVQAAEKKVEGDQQTLASDEATENAFIPQCTSANPPTQCAVNERNVAADRAQLLTDQAALTEAQATQEEQVSEAQQTVTEAQASLQKAQAEQAAGSQPATPAQLDAAKASVSADQAKVVADQQALNDTNLRAPFSGVVAAVNGAVGDMETSQGVRQTPGNVPVTQQETSGISIFPQPPQQPTKTQSDYEPLITINSLATQIVAQVSETSISTVHNGMGAQVSLPAVPGSHFTARVTGIQPIAVTDGGNAYFLVDLSVKDPPAKHLTDLPYEPTGTRAGGLSSEGLLVGATANVLF